MLREWKRQWVVNRQDFLIGLLAAAGMGLLLNALGVILGFASGSERLLVVSGPVYLIVAVLYGYLFGLGNLGSQMNLALAMGATRRRYFLGNAMISFVLCFVLLLGGNLWSLAARFLLGLFHWEAEPVFLLRFPVMLALAAVLTVAGAWGGALWQRLQNHGRLVMILLVVVPLWLAAFFLMGLSSTRSAWGRFCRAVVLFVQSLPGWGLALCVVALLAAMAAHTWALLRKAGVQA